MSARFLILPQNSRHLKNDGACSRRRCQHGTITTRLYAKIQASDIETGDHWQASHRLGRSRSRDHAESVTALEARDHWRSHRCLPGQEAAQASRRGARPPHAGVGPCDARAGFLKKCGGLLHQGGAIKFAFIATGLGIWLAGWLCEAHGISRAGFYVWRTRPRVSGRGPTSSA